MTRIRSDYIHVIVTRYNIGLYRGQVYDPEEWMQHRFPIFCRYCLQSMIKQTNQNFMWLILMDSETPAAWINKILPLLKNNMVLLFIDVHSGDTRVQIVDLIRDFVPNTVRYLITQQHDNDDFLSRDYVSIVHETLKDDLKVPYILDAGMLYYIEEGTIFPVRSRVGIHDKYTTPFGLVVENKETALTCMYMPHHKIRQRFKRYYIIEQLVAGCLNHEMNLSLTFNNGGGRYTMTGAPITETERRNLVGIFGIDI